MLLNENVSLSIKEGSEFQFDIEDHKVVYKASALSGDEQVWVDDELVSEQVNYQLCSKHTFSIDSVPYQIDFVANNLIRGDLDCKLMHQGEMVKGYKVRCLENNSTWHYWLVIALSLLFVALNFYYSVIPFWVVLVIVFACFFILSKWQSVRWVCDDI